MESQRLLGPPPTLMVVAGIVIVAAAAGLIVAPGPVAIVLAALAALVAWRLLGLAVFLTDGTLVIRNVLRTFRFPVGQVDVRARVVDPRREFYAPGLAEGFPEIPTASDDNTPQAAKWYELVHRNELFSIDALMARLPRDHERLAWQLRDTILAAQDAGQGGDPEDRF